MRSDNSAANFEVASSSGVNTVAIVGAGTGRTFGAAGGCLVMVRRTGAAGVAVFDGFLGGCCGCLFHASQTSVHVLAAVLGFAFRALPLMRPHLLQPFSFPEYTHKHLPHGQPAGIDVRADVARNVGLDPW